MTRRLVPLEEAYFVWLSSHVVGIEGGRLGGYAMLLRVLHHTPFRYVVANDENRAMDGAYLREDFTEAHVEYKPDAEWMNLECSYLEMLVALCKIADFESDPGAVPDGVSGWFWIIMGNLGLDIYADALFGDDNAEALEEGIADVLWTVTERQYERNGRGGMFPMRRQRRDQRRLEIWEQLSAYLLENRYLIL